MKTKLRRPLVVLLLSGLVLMSTAAFAENACCWPFVLRTHTTAVESQTGMELVWKDLPQILLFVPLDFQVTYCKDVFDTQCVTYTGQLMNNGVLVEGPGWPEAPGGQTPSQTGVLSWCTEPENPEGEPYPPQDEIVVVRAVDNHGWAGPDCSQGQFTSGTFPCFVDTDWSLGIAPFIQQIPNHPFETFHFARIELWVASDAGDPALFGQFPDEGSCDSGTGDVFTFSGSQMLKRLRASDWPSKSQNTVGRCNETELQVCLPAYFDWAM